MKPDWKPAVEYGPQGWSAVVKRERWWGMQKRYAYWWTFKREWEFSSWPPGGDNSRTKAEQVAVDAAVYLNDLEARNRREIFEVEG